MSYLVSMRDEPVDAPIPGRFEVSDYYSKRLAEARERLAWLRSLSQEQVQQEAAKVHGEDVRSWEDGKARRERDEASYRRMLDQVRAWEPPTPEHARLKSFMVEQLTSSIEFDCGLSSPPPVPESPIQWLARCEAEAIQDVERCERYAAEDAERVAASNRWLEQLRASVPPPQQRSAGVGELPARE